MATLDTILNLLDKWPIWRRIKDAPARIDELEQQVAKLSAALDRCPAEGCPHCGARAWRLKSTGYADREATNETWHCLECKNEQQKWVPTGIKSPKSRR